MSGSKAKADRRYLRIFEHVSQAHDRLHKDDIEACHDVLHQALGISPRVESDVAPLTDGSKQIFDEEFRALCIRTGMVAAFVSMMPPDPSGKTRIVTGGHQGVVQFIDGALRSDPRTIR